MTPTARALLERAITEWRGNPVGADSIADTPSGAELLRRADRPEARVAEGLVCVECGRTATQHDAEVYIAPLGHDFTPTPPTGAA